MTPDRPSSQHSGLRKRIDLVGHVYAVSGQPRIMACWNSLRFEIPRRFLNRKKNSSNINHCHHHTFLLIYVSASQQQHEHDNRGTWESQDWSRFQAACLHKAQILPTVAWQAFDVSTESPESGPLEDHQQQTIRSQSRRRIHARFLYHETSITRVQI